MRSLRTHTIPHPKAQPFFDIPPLFPRSPLRYPGGKQRAINQILSLIPRTETSLCAPFLGGGSVELAASMYLKVHGADCFKPLIDFWDMLLKHPQDIAHRALRYYPLSKTMFYTLQKEFQTFPDPRERAAAFFVLNRASFSGTTLSGGMSPGHPRFTYRCIERLAQWKAADITVSCADYQTVIAKHPGDFLYLDPPYMNKQALYGIKGNTHRLFDHHALAALLHTRDRWILSYNDCKEIRALYAGYLILPVSWTYGMSRNKQSKEVVVVSMDVAKLWYQKNGRRGKVNAPLTRAYSLEK